jgi:hypothetical protein
MDCPTIIMRSLAQTATASKPFVAQPVFEVIAFVDTRFRLVIPFADL